MTCSDCTALSAVVEEPRERAAPEVLVEHQDQLRRLFDGVLDPCHDRELGARERLAGGATRPPGDRAPHLHERARPRLGRRGHGIRQGFDPGRVERVRGAEDDLPDTPQRVGRGVGHVEEALRRRVLPAFDELVLERLHDRPLQAQMLVMPHLAGIAVELSGQVAFLAVGEARHSVDGRVVRAVPYVAGRRGQRSEREGCPFRLPIALQLRRIAPREARSTPPAYATLVAAPRMTTSSGGGRRREESVGRPHVEGDDAERPRRFRTLQTLALGGDHPREIEVIGDVRAECRRTSVAERGRVPEQHAHLDPGPASAQHEPERGLVLLRLPPREVRGPRSMCHSFAVERSRCELNLQPVKYTALLPAGPAWPPSSRGSSDSRIALIARGRRRGRHLAGLVPRLLARVGTPRHLGAVTPRATVTVLGGVVRDVNGRNQMAGSAASAPQTFRLRACCEDRSLDGKRRSKCPPYEASMCPPEDRPAGTWWR